MSSQIAPLLDPLATEEPPREHERAPSGWTRGGAARSMLGTFLGYIATLIFVSLVTFLAIRLTAGDVAVLVLGREATPDQLEAFRQDNGLNDPILVQYLNWLTAFLRGDWGVDPISGLPVKEQIAAPYAHTIVLALLSLFVSVPLALGMGLWSATRHGRPSDRASLTVSIILAATPEFVIAVVAVLVVGVWLGWLPVDSSSLGSADSLAGKLRAIALPVLVLALALGAYFYRVARASCFEVLQTGYVEAARLRGLSSTQIMRKYVLRNSTPPVVNAVAIGAVHLIGGVILVEQVFGYPGLGRALISAIAAGNLDMVQAIVMVLAASFLVVGVAADLFVHFLTRPLVGR